MRYKFKIVARKNDQYGVQFLHQSEIMVWSESYSSKSSAKNCISSLIKHAPSAPVIDLSRGEEGSGYRFEIVKSKNGEFYNRFVARNGETMVRSETYTDKRNAKKCAASLAKNAPEAPLIDES